LAIFDPFLVIFGHFWPKNAVFGLFRTVSLGKQYEIGPKIDKKGSKNGQCPGPECMGLELKSAG